MNYGLERCRHGVVCQLVPLEGQEVGWVRPIASECPLCSSGNERIPYREHPETPIK